MGDSFAECSPDLLTSKPESVGVWAIVTCSSGSSSGCKDAPCAPRYVTSVIALESCCLRDRGSGRGRAVAVPVEKGGISQPVVSLQWRRALDPAADQKMSYPDRVYGYSAACEFCQFCGVCVLAGHLLTVGEVGDHAARRNRRLRPILGESGVSGQVIWPCCSHRCSIGRSKHKPPNLSMIAMAVAIASDGCLIPTVPALETRWDSLLSVISACDVG